ncbi:hypothetical protein AB0F95_02600 [Micromonospora tulbaghiae]|uniref:hypothetical protein n=1 Tax=Micromonospora tulbaghiae TaxID=479978 RepID=UPI0033C10849
MRHAFNDRGFPGQKWSWVRRGTVYSADFDWSLLWRGNARSRVPAGVALRWDHPVMLIDALSVKVRRGADEQLAYLVVLSGHRR